MPLLFPILGIIFVWDIIKGRIPNTLVFAGIGLSLLVHANSGMDQLGLSIIGGIVGGVLLLPMYGLRYMGGGDVKLAVLIGSAVQFPQAIFAVLVGIAVGAILIPLFQLIGLVNQDGKVPFAPMLIAGMGASFFLGDYFI